MMRRELRNNVNVTGETGTASAGHAPIPGNKPLAMAPARVKHIRPFQSGTVDNKANNQRNLSYVAT
jgi:hypothetical protein